MLQKPCLPHLAGREACLLLLRPHPLRGIRGVAQNFPVKSTFHLHTRVSLHSQFPRSSRCLVLNRQGTIPTILLNFPRLLKFIKLLKLRKPLKLPEFYSRLLQATLTIITLATTITITGNLYPLS